MFTPTLLAERLEPLLAALPAPPAGRARTLCVALSGGLDSAVLLAACARLVREQRLASPLRALHVDHGLQPESVVWALACARLAEGHGVPFLGLRVTVATGDGDSPEAAARDARYAALAAQLAPGDVLLTAHHADDQLETVLLQWLRGGGLRAVAGMAPSGPFGAHGWHLRPLLGFARADLAAWATANGLRWLEDPSNLDPRFDRNYLRLAVLPAVRRRWPAAAATVGRVAGFARDALAAEESLAQSDLATLLAGTALDLAGLGQLPDARQRAALRGWLAGLGLPLPAARTLAALRHDVAVAADDRVPEVRWAGVCVRRYRGRLYATAETDGDGPGRESYWPIEPPAPYAWSGGSALELEPAVGVGLSRARTPAQLQVRLRRGGESFTPGHGSHRRPLRKWLQEHDVLPWRRADLPLLFAGERLAAVADLAIAGEFAALPGEPSWRVAWRGRAPVTEADVLASKWPAHPLIR